jgi:hypothetical protein
MAAAPADRPDPRLSPRSLLPWFSPFLARDRREGKPSRPRWRRTASTVGSSEAVCISELSRNYSARLRDARGFRAYRVFDAATGMNANVRNHF